jgi:hypothetical protein
MVTFLGVYFTRLCFKLNNLTGQKFGMSELKLSWPVTLTADPPAVILRSDTCIHLGKWSRTDKSDMTLFSH